MQTATSGQSSGRPEQVLPRCGTAAIRVGVNRPLSLLPPGHAVAMLERWAVETRRPRRQY